MITIIDCYTDEPAGLGVPPYVGTYPRYIAGAILNSGKKVKYLTIDDLRAHFSEKYKGSKEDIEEQNFARMKTDIKIRNLTSNFDKIKDILEKSEMIIFIVGVHTPGKYLSAIPGTMKEAEDYVKRLKKINYNPIILTGPATKSGTGLFGGKIATKVHEGVFDKIVEDIEIHPEIFENNEIKNNTYTYDKIKDIAIKGAEIVKQFPHKEFLIAEIEASKGCSRKTGCSFCTEPLKAKVENRNVDEIIEEIKELHKHGIRNFRIGKQSDLFSYPDMEKLLKNASKYADILHIDNINPANVTEEKVKTVVKYCTAGNIAAMGQESFDDVVIENNNLNSNAKLTYKAIKIMNKYGAKRGDNGLPEFLPGINILFGLNKESKKTHEANIFWLQKFLDEDLLIRRINVRQVVIFPGTPLFADVKNKFIKKNKKYYWKWRNDIRQKIDSPMLKNLVPEGAILKNLRAEIYDGNTTFLRQIGTYPLIVGVKERLQLDKFYDVKIIGHMLRSLVGKVI